LDAPGHDGDYVVESFGVVSVDPVDDVEGPVGAQGKQVVRGDGLCLAGLGDHEELGEDGHGLQVDGQGPQNLHHRELVVQEERQQHARTQQELDPEGVVVVIIGCLELEEHEIDGPDGGGQEEDFHHRVVDRDEAGEQVEVPGQEHQREQNLGTT